MDSDKPVGVVSQYEIDLIFKPFRDLHNHSHAMLQSFKNAKDGEFVKMAGNSLGGQYAIASVFCKYVMDFNCFSKYVQQYCHAKRTLDELCTGRKGFEKWLKGVMSKPEFKVFLCFDGSAHGL